MKDYNQSKLVPQWNYSLLKHAHFIFMIFVPFIFLYSLNINHSVFVLLNDTLRNSDLWRKIIFVLNHRKESSFNILVMLSISIAAIFLNPRVPKIQAVAMLFYFCIFYEFCVLINYLIFNKILHIKVLSPSLKFESIKLSEIFHSNNIKERSYASFPSGHAMVFVYWACATSFYANNKMRIILSIIAVIFCIPRMVVGAHWLSDVTFSIAWILLLFVWSIATPLYGYAINFFVGLFLKLVSITKSIRFKLTK